jgi:hypothetical protein
MKRLRAEQKKNNESSANVLSDRVKQLEEKLIGMVDN